MRRMDGEKVSALYPGRSVHLPHGLMASRDGVRDEQKSAEGIVAIAHDGEGPNVTRGLGTKPRWAKETQTGGLGGLRTPGR